MLTQGGYSPISFTVIRTHRVELSRFLEDGA